MQHLLTIFLIYLQLTDLTWVAEASEPYCTYNKTEFTYIKVNKTREVKVVKPWYKKLSKPATKVEYYEEDEPVPKITPVRGCCEGYEMSELRLCEPKCSEGCPENSKCVEPDICKCKQGYFSSLSEHDGKHYCEPICERPCPEHSACVRPNVCACRKGYRVGKHLPCEPLCESGCPGNGECIAPNHCKCQEGFRSEKGSCLPICSLGDQCKNGICRDKELCECNFGFALNEETHRCEPNLAIYNSMTDTTSVYWEETTPSMQEDTVNDSSDYDISASEVFEEAFESTTWQSQSTDWQDANHKCPVDFVLYRGQCQPLKFAIDEIDCRLQPCSDPQALCTDNGTCACREGYRMFRKLMHTESTEAPQQLVKPVCLTIEEYQLLIVAPSEEEVHVNEAAGDASPSVALIFFIVLGVVIMVSALVYVGLRLVRAHSGHLDVEGKQLSCAYDNRVCADAEKSVI